MAVALSDVHLYVAPLALDIRGRVGELEAAAGGRIDPPPLHPGDVVEMTVEGIGTITNTVVAGLAGPVTAPARVLF